MNEQGNKILIDVAVEASAALKELAKLRAKNQSRKRSRCRTTKNYLVKG